MTLKRGSFLQPKTESWRTFFLNPSGMHHVQDSIVQNKSEVTEKELFDGFIPYKERGSAGFIFGLAAGLQNPSQFRFSQKSRPKSRKSPPTITEKRGSPSVGGMVELMNKSVKLEMRHRNKKRQRTNNSVSTMKVNEMD